MSARAALNQRRQERLSAAAAAAAARRGRSPSRFLRQAGSTAIMRCFRPPPPAARQRVSATLEHRFSSQRAHSPLLPVQAAVHRHMGHHLGGCGAAAALEARCVHEHQVPAAPAARARVLGAHGICVCVLKQKPVRAKRLGFRGTRRHYAPAVPGSGSPSSRSWPAGWCSNDRTLSSASPHALMHLPLRGPAGAWRHARQPLMLLGEVLNG